MNIRETTPPEAYETLQADPAAVYLDVRTEAEFEAGHPAGARNVPVVLFDPATRRPIPNRDFVATVERTIPRTAKLLVGCQSGPRSARACEVLAQAGFTDLTNVRGGFGGEHDQAGRVVVTGWREAGLPVETGR
ncbi:MAG TPA: rhodanese-like domain-containing protein [Verrucomicrobiae bacterium]|nr:rhodanese-like domain-containing protein [Verrucomicrobiae bacterium]